ISAPPIAASPSLKSWPEFLSSILRWQRWRSRQFFCDREPSTSPPSASAQRLLPCFWLYLRAGQGEVETIVLSCSTPPARAGSSLKSPLSSFCNTIVRLDLAQIGTVEGRRVMRTRSVIFVLGVLAVFGPLFGLGGTARAADVICYNCPPQWADF